MMVDIVTDTLADAMGFRELPFEALERLAERGSRRRFHRGEQLFRQGDPAVSLFVILRGQVRLSCVHPDLFETDSLADLGPKELVGESAVLDGGRRWATATALEDTDVFELGLEAIAGTIIDHPALTPKLLASVSRKLQNAAALEAWYRAQGFGRGSVARS